MSLAAVRQIKIKMTARKLCKRNNVLPRERERGEVSARGGQEVSTPGENGQREKKLEHEGVRDGSLSAVGC